MQTSTQYIKGKKHRDMDCEYHFSIIELGNKQHVFLGSSAYRRVSKENQNIKPSKYFECFYIIQGTPWFTRWFTQSTSVYNECV